MSSPRVLARSVSASRRAARWAPAQNRTETEAAGGATWATSAWSAAWAIWGLRALSLLRFMSSIGLSMVALADWSRRRAVSRNRCKDRRQELGAKDHDVSRLRTVDPFLGNVVEDLAVPDRQTRLHQFDEPRAVVERRRSVGTCHGGDQRDVTDGKASDAVPDSHGDDGRIVSDLLSDCLQNLGEVRIVGVLQFGDSLAVVVVTYHPAEHHLGAGSDVSHRRGVRGNL
jgi:hypothetical protein